MRRFGKRLLALCCCMILAATLFTAVSAETTENCPGGCSHAAAIGTTHYDTLSAAFAAATDGCTVKLLVDTATTELTLDKDITLDLGGKTVTGTVAEAAALLNITGDLTLKNGTLSTTGTALRAADCAVVIDKTVEISADANAVELSGSGKLTVTGGTITAKENAVVLTVADDKTMEASITGGKFYAENGETVVLNKGANTTAPEGFVIGGTFNKLPTDYIPAYCRTTDNGDNTYTITAEYSVSISGNGGSGTMAPIKADRGTTITLPKCTLTAPAGKHFKAWQIGGNTYAPGATYAVNGDLTLTAVWESHYGGNATCNKKAVCSGCGATYGSYAPHALTSNGGQSATCESAGVSAYSVCSSCGKYYSGGVQISASTLTIPALGHDWQQVKGTPATCTEEGLNDHEKCSHCDQMQIDGKEVTEEDLVIPALGHTLENIPAADPTCTAAGVIAHEACANCGILLLNGQEVQEDALSVPVVSHILSDWENDASTHWKFCTGCGEIFRLHSHGDADNDAACDECGYAMAASQEAVNAAKKEGFSFLFLIPIAIAVVICVGVAVKVAKKKAE